MKRKNPLKPNFCVCVAGLLATGVMGCWLYARVTKLLGELSGAETVGQAQDAAIGLLAHIVGGGSLLLPITSGLVAWGIKLLDERPPDQPMVPANVVLAMIDAQGAAAVAGATRLADDLEKR